MTYRSICVGLLRGNDRNPETLEVAIRPAADHDAHLTGMLLVPPSRPEDPFFRLTIDVRQRAEGAGGPDSWTNQIPTVKEFVPWLCAISALNWCAIVISRTGARSAVTSFTPS